MDRCRPAWGSMGVAVRCGITTSPAGKPREALFHGGNGIGHGQQRGDFLACQDKHDSCLAYATVLCIYRRQMLAVTRRLRRPAPGRRHMSPAVRSGPPARVRTACGPSASCASTVTSAVLVSGRDALSRLCRQHQRRAITMPVSSEKMTSPGGGWTISSLPNSRKRSSPWRQMHGDRADHVAHIEDRDGQRIADAHQVADVDQAVDAGDVALLLQAAKQRLGGAAMFGGVGAEAAKGRTPGRQRGNVDSGSAGSASRTLPAPRHTPRSSASGVGPLRRPTRRARRRTRPETRPAGPDGISEYCSCLCRTLSCWALILGRSAGCTAESETCVHCTQLTRAARKRQRIWSLSAAPAFFAGAFPL